MGSSEQNSLLNSWPNLKELSDELLYNYFACSFGNEIENRDILRDKTHLDRINYNLKKIQDTKLNPKGKNKLRRTRNIVVIGAGASIDNYPAIPGGKQLQLELEKHFRKDNLKYSKYLENKFKDLESTIISMSGRTTLSFENFLYILSEHFVTQKDLRGKIEELTSFYNAPSLFNEIIAHLLKHSFIDAVINFNFEETLDTAILEEIGLDNLHFILSDGHCVNLDEITAAGTLRRPIYIKPHGTNSHKSTLRFTNRHYFDIPNDISLFLKCLFGGYNKSIHLPDESKYDTPSKIRAFNKKKSGKQRFIDVVNIILIGFNNESPEFLDILNKYLPKHSKFHYINIEKPSKELIERVYFNQLKDFLSEQYNPRKNNIKDGFNRIFNFIDINRESNDLHSLNGFEKTITNNKGLPNTSLSPLSRLFNYIYSEIWYSYSKQYKPQHILRHKLTCLLFHDPYLRSLETSVPHKLKSSQNHIKKAFETAEYFLDRTIVDVAIALLRGHGAVDFYGLADLRVGAYYTKYLKAISNTNNNKNIPVTLVDILVGFDVRGINNGAIENNLLSIFCINNWKKLKKPASFQKNKDNLLESLINSINSLVKNDKYFTRTRGNDNGMNTRSRNIAGTILYKLFTHPQISKTFLSRVDQTKQLIFPQLSKTSKSGYELNLLTHIDLIVFASNHLVANNFYSISTNSKDKNLEVWQSYSLKHQIRTSLSLDHQLYEYFEKTDYNLVLSTSEVGGNILGWLKQKKQLNTKVYQICSYEAIKQLHITNEASKTTKDTKSNQAISVLTSHFKYMLGLPSDWELVNSTNLEIFAIPFTLHNHHMTLFCNIKGEKLELKRCVYIWRRGFSTKMSPLFIDATQDASNKIKSQKDLETMYLLFIKYLNRGVMFAKFNKIESFYKSSSIKDLIPSRSSYDVDSFSLESIKDFDSRFKEVLMKSYS